MICYLKNIIVNPNIALICVLIFIGKTTTISAQTIGVQLKKIEAPTTFLKRNQTPTFSNGHNLNSTTTKPTVMPPFAAFSAEKLPFFCRIEHNFHKKISTPLFFRLGTLDVVNELEGKTNVVRQR